MTDDENPDWARGYDVDELEAAAEVFQEHDEDMVLSMFSKVQERDIAQWKDEGELIHQNGYCIAWEQPSKPKNINDFRRETRGKVRKGEIYIKRFACEPGAEDALIDMLGSILGVRNGWVRCWQEHPIDRRIMDELNLEWGCTQITAASELEGYWTQGDVHCDDTAPEDRLTLERAPADFSLQVDKAAEEMESVIDEWTGHYSKYGDPDTWSALALKGFGGKSGFISKPSEMSQQWKDENPEKLDWKPEDTPLREKLPAMEPLIDGVPGQKERIRLMRLGPDDSKIERHADITDPDAGAQFGELMRMHIPLITNPGVKFKSWDLMGNTIERHFGAGDLFYLDTRKPHAVVNEGDSDRVHLVMDVRSNEELLEMYGIEKKPVGGYF